MEQDRFDGITRLFAHSSRRRVIGALAAGALTTLLPNRAGAFCSPGDCDETFECGEKFCDKITCRTIFAPAGTLCRSANGPCDVAEVCTGNSLNCPDDRQAPNGTPCPDDGNPCTNDVCNNGQCVHPAKANGTACADDGNPCTDDVCQGGACTHPNKADGVTCAAGKVCRAGACQCAPGADTCGEFCTDLQRDPNNCGRCNRVCGNSQVCCRGECAKLSSDEANCGRCGRRCRSGERCRDGRCRKS